jgi:tetratricopeptide (TPR) repeat protein
MPETPADQAVSRGLISPEQRDHAHLMAKTSGKSVTDALVELGLVTPEVARELAEFRQKFGRYELQKEVGRGGMGIVYRAWQPDLKRIVAIKIVTSTSEEDLKRFRREAETAAKLSHPNIAPIYEVGSEDNRPFIAMAFIDGRTLTKAEVSMQRKVEALRDAARALHAAHQQGIIHRDVKPDNIMIDRTGRAFIMDFGLAKSIKPGSSLTMGGIVMGTPSYMSPEQAQGRIRAMTPRSDVYSLGATLYEVLTGLPPFIAEDFMTVLLMVLKDDPEPPRNRRPGIPADLETICLKALQKVPGHRYGTAADFADDIDRWLGNEPILARRSGALSRATQRLRRQPLLVAAVLLLAAISTGAIVLIVRANRKVTDTTAENEREREAMKKARPIYDRGLSLLDRAESLAMRDEAGSIEAARQALAEFDEAVVIAPAFGDAWHARGRARSLTGGPPALVDADFARATELNPDSPRILLDWGIAVIRDRAFPSEVILTAFYDDPRRPVIPTPLTATLDGYAVHRGRANENFRKVAMLAAKPEEKYFADGVLTLISDNAPRAETLFTQSLGVDDRHFWSRVCRGFARTRISKWKDAVDDLSMAIREKPAYLRARQFRSYAAQYAGEWATAIDDIEWLFLREKEAAEKIRLKLRRAMCLKFAGRTDEAATELEEIIALDRKREEPYLFRSHLFAEQGRPDKAADEVRRLLAVDASSRAAHFAMGLLSYRSGDWPAAAEHFSKSDPRDPWTAYWQGKTALGAGTPKREWFATFVAAGLEKESAHHESLAWLAILDGKPDEAIAPLLKAQELAPDDASLWSTLGHVHALRKDDTAAFNAYYEAVKRQPSDYHARLKLGQYHLARDLDDKAEAELTVALTLRDTSEARFTRGVARRKLKRFEGARSDFEEAAKDPHFKAEALQQIAEMK